VPTPDFIRKALLGRAEQRLPVGYGLWKDDAMRWGYVLSVDKATFRVREVTPSGRLVEEETYSYAKVTFFDLDPVYAARLVALSSHPGEPAQAWGSTARGIRRVIQHACASGSPIEVKTRPDRRRWRVRVVGVQAGWVEWMELDDLCRDVHEWIYRLTDVEAVSLDPGDAYLRGLVMNRRLRTRRLRSRFSRQ
jgi:hypothetical protein